MSGTVCTAASLSSFPAQSNNISSVRKSTRLCKATTARQQQEHTSRYLTNINTTLSQSLVSVSITHHHHRQSLNSSNLHIIHQVRYSTCPNLTSSATEHPIIQSASQTDNMSNNAVQPIETSHYTYDAHKPSTTNNKQESTHHSAAQPAASKIHPVVDRPLDYPHAAPTTATSPVVATPTQHPHAAERSHAVAEHAQPAVLQHPAHPTTALVPSKDKETSKHAQVEAAKNHPQATSAAAAVTPKDKETPKHAQTASPSQTSTSPQATTATSAPHPHVAFEYPIVVAIEVEEEEEYTPFPPNVSPST